MFGIPGIDSSDALVGALSLLLSALGLSSAAGLRAYLPLLAVAIGSHITTASGAPLVHLTPQFQVLATPGFMIALAALAVVEFVVDKIPFLVHISDLIQTLIRPAAGAIIMAGTHNALSDHSVIAAAVVGGLLALTVHGAKSATRAGVTVTTAGFGNPVVSLGEDLITLLVTVLSILIPILAAIFLVIILIATAPLVARGIRRYFARRPRPAA